MHFSLHSLDNLEERLVSATCEVLSKYNWKASFCSLVSRGRIWGELGSEDSHRRLLASHTVTIANTADVLNSKVPGQADPWLSLLWLFLLSSVLKAFLAPLMKLLS